MQLSNAREERDDQQRSGNLDSSNVDRCRTRESTSTMSMLLNFKLKGNSAKLKKKQVGLCLHLLLPCRRRNSQPDQSDKWYKQNNEHYKESLMVDRRIIWSLKSIKVLFSDHLIYISLLLAPQSLTFNSQLRWFRDVSEIFIISYFTVQRLNEQIMKFVAPQYKQCLLLIKVQSFLLKFFSHKLL